MISMKCFSGRSTSKNMENIDFGRTSVIGELEVFISKHSQPVERGETRTWRNLI